MPGRVLRFPEDEGSTDGSDPIYWEGAATALIGGRRVGRGYLELMTGYAAKLEL